MSESSERKAMVAILPAYALMSIPEVARYMDVTHDVAAAMIEDGTIPSVKIGRRKKVDPMDVVVHVLAGREGITAAEYWEVHGEATAEHVKKYIARIRRVLAA